MATNEDKITILNEDKNNNLIKISELQTYMLSLDSQININLLSNTNYELEKTNSETKITELQNNNSIIDEMIADYS